MVNAWTFKIGFEKADRGVAQGMQTQRAMTTQATLSRAIMVLGIGLGCLAPVGCGADPGDVAAESLESDPPSDGKADGVTTSSSKPVMSVGSKFAFNAGIEASEIRQCDKTEAGCYLSPDFVNAYWLAYLSKLAYSPKADILAGLTKVGMKPKRFAFFNNEHTGAQAFYVRVSHLAVLVFRGTETDRIEDVVTDGALHRDSNIHAGFLDQFRSIWSLTYYETGDVRTGLGDYLKSEFLANAPETFYLAGHSLGGALATLGLSVALAQDIPVRALYAYGCPRVGNHDFAQDLFLQARERNTPVFRFVHAQDIVPDLPSTFLGYSHLGEQENDTLIHVTSDDPPFVELGTSSEPEGTSVDDHDMTEYLKQLQAYANLASGQIEVQARRCEHGAPSCKAAPR